MTHGQVATSYRRGCRCLDCRRSESLRVRAACERACVECGGPCWGVRCKECLRRGKVRRSIQPPGLLYQWGCP